MSKLALPKLGKLPENVRLTSIGSGTWRMIVPGKFAVTVHASNDKQARRKALLYYRRAVALRLV